MVKVFVWIAGPTMMFYARDAGIPFKTTVFALTDAPLAIVQGFGFAPNATALKKTRTPANNVDRMIT
jgi:hypothetical protein